MNVKELVAEIAGKTEASQAATQRFLAGFVEVVSDSLANGEDVKIAGFGTFKKAAVAAKMGRNPRTGEPVPVEAGYKAKFDAGKLLKESVRGK